MFKKPLGDLKTSAPLRSSDRRKLRQRVIETFSLNPEDGDVLVPEGLRSCKFSTHLGDPGVVYLSPEGDPLWFTVGKGSDDLIPTVYTLWKQRTLLPYLSTPARVIPVLIGGADLMCPGVVQHSRGLVLEQLVGITQYKRGALGAPLAVGRMAVSGDTLSSDDPKGKAVYVLHTWKDNLWEMGKGKDLPVPEPELIPLEAVEVEEEDTDGGEGEDEDRASRPMDDAVTDSTNGLLDGGIAAAEPSEAQEPAAEPTSSEQKTLAPQEVSSILRTSLLQSISTILSALPSSAFPMAASTFYTSHLLPSRPVYPTYDTPVDIKHSAYKNLAAFLKACEKEGLIGLKQSKGDAMIASVNKTHADVVAHRPYRTFGQEMEKQQKREARDRDAEGRRQEKAREMVVNEFWKPHQTTVRLFEETGKDPEALYTQPELLALFNDYISEKKLANPNDQAYLTISADNALFTSLGSPNEEFMKRDVAFRRLLDKMQMWHEITVEGKDPVLRKGELKRISVVVKIRAGRKACTLVTGFEPYSLDADDLAEELRRVCASSTAVAPLQGKNAGLEVMVQGKQTKAVSELLVGKGVPMRWIKAPGLAEKKKK